jgi:hypothetical protein
MKAGLKTAPKGHVTETAGSREAARALAGSAELGNQAVQRLFRSAALHPKLAVGSVDDPPEQEADRVADRVMRSSAPLSGLSSASPQVSRKCAECDEEDKKLQKKEAGSDTILARSASTPIPVRQSPPERSMRGPTRLGPTWRLPTISSRRQQPRARDCWRMSWRM